MPKFMTVNESKTLGLGYLQRSRYSDPLRDRILVGARISIPVLTDTVPHPDSCTMSTGSFFPVIKRPGRVVDHPHSSTTEVKERVELYRYSPSGSSWSVVG